MQEITAREAWSVLQGADCLHSGEEVERAIHSMADQISSRVADRNPICVCVLNGGTVPFGKLLTKLDFPLVTDYIHATRYGGALTGGGLSWIAGPHVDPKGRTVLLIDDIFDEGTTLEALVEHYRSMQAQEIVTAVLVTKDRERETSIRPDISGLTVPNRYVFGCGMDYKGYLRNAPGIYAEKQ
jgi:hypoxanthine phosphoribosyltransferase